MFRIRMRRSVHRAAACALARTHIFARYVASLGTDIAAVGADIRRLATIGTVGIGGARDHTHIAAAVSGAARRTRRT